MFHGEQNETRFHSHLPEEPVGFATNLSLGLLLRIGMERVDFGLGPGVDLLDLGLSL